MLEAHPPTPPPQGDVDLRVSAVSRASQRILTAVGAWPLVPAQRLSPYEDMIVWDAAGKPRGAGAIHFSASATSEPNLGHIVENRRLQWALYDCAPFRQRVTLLRAELAGMTLERDRAVVSLGDGRTLSAALVVGSDGAASLSRKLAGIETAGWDYDQRAFVTHVRTEHPHARTAWQRFLADGPIAFLPLADGRSSIVWTTRPEHARAPRELSAGRGGAEIEQAQSTVSWARSSSPAPRAHFPLRLTHARQYCKERFALVGDAAHAMHPLAGQGVNLGFLDCAALVEVLAQELASGGDRGGARRAAGVATLRALAQEREPDRARAGRRSESPVQHLRRARWAGSAAPGSARWTAARSPSGSSWAGRWARAVSCRRSRGDAR